MSAQYSNEVIETDLQWEDYQTTKLFDDTIVSIGTIRDSNSSSSGYTHMEFRKYDLNYNLLTSSRYTDTTYFKTGFYGLEKHKDAYYSCGTKYIDNQDTLLGFVTKFDQNGGLIWEKNYHSIYNKVKVLHMISDDSLIYLLSSITDDSFPASINQLEFTAIDSSGNVQWSESWTGNIAISISLSKTSTSGFVLSYWESFGGGDYKTRVIKMDSARNILWNQVYGKMYNSHSLHVTELPNGNFLGHGFSEKNIQLGDDPGRYWLAEIDGNTGQLIQDSVFIYDDYDCGFASLSSIILEDDYFILSGRAKGLTDSGYMSTISSFSYDFELNWTRYYHPRENHGLGNPFKKDGFYHFHGIAGQDATSPTDDVWFLVVDSLGCDDQMCTVGINEPYVENEKIFSVYPNPTSGKLNLEFSENYYDWEYSSFQLLDLTGKVLDQFQTNGTTTSYSFDNLDNGIYLVQLLVEGQIVQTQKIVYQK